MFPQFTDPSVNAPSIFGTYTPVAHGGVLPQLGGWGMAANMMLAPYLHQFIQGQGMMPGQFSPVQNLYDQHLARSQMIRQQQAMSMTADMDRNQLATQFAGMFRMFNPDNQLTAEQAKLTQRLSNDVGRILPMLTPFAPGTVDALLGARGSAQAMGLGFAQGSRYLADGSGVTGGISGEQVSQLVRQMYPRYDVSEMRGMGGAQLGQLFAEASQRGFLGEVTGKGGKLDGSRIQNRLKELSGAVSAMKDIFGDLGRQDAPMSELFSALENLTQSGLSRMGAGRAEKLAREVQQMAKLTGVGMDAVLTMHTGAASLASSMGLDRSFAPQAVKSSLAFATAYGQTSGGFSAWGKMGKEEMMAYDQRLRMQAAGSEMANQAGAVMRLGDQGLLQGDARKLYEQIKSGDTSALQYMAPGDFVEFLQKGGVSRNAAAQAMHNRYANQEFVQRYNLGDKVREQQREADVIPKMQAVLGQSLAASLAGRLGNRQAAAMAGQTGDALSRALFRMDRGLLAGNKVNERNAFLVEQLRKSMTPEQLASLGKTEEERNRTLQEMVVTGMGTLQEESRGVFGTDMVNVITAHHQDTIDRARKIDAQARVRAEISTAMSKVPQLGAVRGLMEELSSGKDLNLERLAARFLGGVDKADALKKAMPALQNLAKQQKEVEAIRVEMENLESDTTLSAEEKQKRKAALQKRLGTAAAEMKEKTDFIKESGLNVEIGQVVKQQRIDELLQMAGGDRKAVTNLLGKVGDTRKNLLEAARKSGLLKDRKDEEVGEEELADLLAEAQRGDKGKLGKEGAKALEALGADITEKLRTGDISLDEFARILQDKLKKDEDEEKRRLTLEGTLKIVGDDEGHLTARGVADPRGGRP